MSRWHDEFDNHPFQLIWKQLLNITNNISLDGSDIVTDVQEVARLKKVIKYIESLLEACDKELVPLQTWGNFQGQCQNCLQQVSKYHTNRNIVHMSAANGHLDNLLSYLKPYVVDGRGAARASTIAQKEYNKTVSGHISGFVKEANTAISKIHATSKRVDLVAREIEPVVNKVKSFENRVFHDKNSLEAKIDHWATEVEGTASRIQVYYKSLFTDKSGKNSLESEINELVDNIKDYSNTLENLVDDAESNGSTLEEYCGLIFGNPESNEPKKQGLKKEFEARQSNLEELIDGHKTKYNALVEEVESLIPGATTAGLATAYTALKKKAGSSMRWFSLLFFISLAGLMALSSVFVIQDFTWTPFKISFIGIVSLEDTLKLILQRLPFVAPLVWLALFASKRRSETHRLEQEYAHKESTAKSYHSFKQQITKMGEANEHKGLLTQLITSAVETVAFNASTTLDKKHGDKLPSKAAIDGVLDLFEKAKGIFK